MTYVRAGAQMSPFIRALGTVSSGYRINCHLAVVFSIGTTYLLFLLNNWSKELN